MPLLGSVPISGYVAPTSASDVYPAHDSVWGKGGWREVEDLIERDAITFERRREGMAVYVKSVDTVFILKGGITNVDWDTLQLGGNNTALVNEIEGGNSLTTYDLDQFILDSGGA